jgi:hypothetical protein
MEHDVHIYIDGAAKGILEMAVTGWGGKPYKKRVLRGFEPTNNRMKYWL